MSRDGTRPLAGQMGNPDDPYGINAVTTDRDMMLVWEAWAKQDGNDGAAALFRRVYEQLADSERLDWWESQRTYTLAPVMDAQGWRLHLPDVLRSLDVPFNRTLRAAIDEVRVRPPAEYVQDFGGTVECINPAAPGRADD